MICEGENRGVVLRNFRPCIHTPVPQPDWLNRTINIDTGCVFGGSLTALRCPERELVSVDARATYAQPARPLVGESETGPSLTSQQIHDDLLDIDDVIGKRIVTTRLHHNVTLREENALAALWCRKRRHWYLLYAHW
jgi:protein phosphatase